MTASVVERVGYQTPSPEPPPGLGMPTRAPRRLPQPMMREACCMCRRTASRSGRVLLLLLLPTGR